MPSAKEKLERLHAEAAGHIEERADRQQVFTVLLIAALSFLITGACAGWWLLAPQPDVFFRATSALIWSALFALNGLLCLCAVYYVAVAIGVLRSWARENRMRRDAVKVAAGLIRDRRDS